MRYSYMIRPLHKTKTCNLSLSFADQILFAWVQARMLRHNRHHLHVWLLTPTRMNGANEPGLAIVQLLQGRGKRGKAACTKR